MPKNQESLLGMFLSSDGQGPPASAEDRRPRSAGGLEPAATPAVPLEPLYKVSFFCFRIARRATLLPYSGGSRAWLRHVGSVKMFRSLNSIRSRWVAPWRRATFSL